MDEIASDNVFRYIRLLQGHSEASINGIEGVSDGFKTVGGFREFKRKVILDVWQVGWCGFLCPFLEFLEEKRVAFWS